MEETNPNRFMRKAPFCKFSSIYYEKPVLSSHPPGASCPAVSAIGRKIRKDPENFEITAGRLIRCVYTLLRTIKPGKNGG